MKAIICDRCKKTIVAGRPYAIIAIRVGSVGDDGGPHPTMDDKHFSVSEFCEGCGDTIMGVMDDSRTVMHD